MSNNTFPQRLTKIDDLTRGDHHYLQPDDECFFFGEYTARAGYAAGPTNDLIHNFKKSVDRKGRPEWRYKERAIADAAAAFSTALTPGFLEQATLIPMPPSKAKADPRYDDRITGMLGQIKCPKPADIRELLLQTATREAGAHDGDRLGPDELTRLYSVDEGLCAPAPRVIGVFDDLLVTGASFVAARRVLSARFPAVKVYGLFLARRGLPNVADGFEPIDLE